MSCERVTRRGLLQGIAGGTALTANMSINVTATSYPLKAEYLYVWKQRARNIVLDGESRAQFIRHARQLDLSNVFLSSGALRNANQDILIQNNRSPLRDFVKTCNEHGINVHMTIPQKGPEGIRTSVADDLPELKAVADAHGFTGIHFEHEPYGDGRALIRFLESYDTQLDRVDTGNLQFSIAIAWWWFKKEPEKAIPVREHNAVNFVTSMSFYDEAERIQKRLAWSLINETESTYPFEPREMSNKPFVLVIEISDAPSNESTTFHQEGLEQAATELEWLLDAPITNLRENPQFQGVCIQDYDALLKLA